MYRISIRKIRKTFTVTAVLLTMLCMQAYADEIVLKVGDSPITVADAAAAAAGIMENAAPVVESAQAEVRAAAESVANSGAAVEAMASLRSAVSSISETVVQAMDTEPNGGSEQSGSSVTVEEIEAPSESAAAQSSGSHTVSDTYVTEDTQNQQHYEYDPEETLIEIAEDLLEFREFKIADNTSSNTELWSGSGSIASGSYSAPTENSGTGADRDSAVSAASAVPGGSPSARAGASVVSVGPGGSTSVLLPVKKSGSSGVPSVITTASRSAVINYAKQFLGNPYVYGGTSLTEGCDCSGYIQQIFKHFGITTGRTSRDQFANCQQISESALQPGDLVFYADGDYVNHVALYAGDGIILHAANSRVGIITSKYRYREPYGYGRFIND